MSEGELPDFELDDSYTIPSTGESHNLDNTVDYSDDEESFQEDKTTLPDETRDDSSFQSQGSLHLSDLQGGAAKKKKKKTATKKKTAKKKTATKKKTAKKKTAKKKATKKKATKKKTAKKKTATKKTATKKKTAKKKTATKKKATKKKTAKKKTATKKKTEEKKKGILGLFMGGKNKKKIEKKKFISPMERLI